jgi:hypothetical protein
MAWWRVFEPKNETLKIAWAKSWLAITIRCNGLSGVGAYPENVLPPFKFLNGSGAYLPAVLQLDPSNDPIAKKQLQSGGWICATL